MRYSWEVEASTIGSVDGGLRHIGSSVYVYKGLSWCDRNWGDGKVDVRDSEEKLNSCGIKSEDIGFRGY